MAQLYAIIATCRTKKQATESGSRNGVQVQRCEHGIYRSPNETKAWGCVQCYPDGHPAGPTPVLPRSSADPLNANRTEKLEACDCGCPRTYSSTQCRACGKPYAPDSSLGRVQGSANAHAQGVCPACSSTIHYATKKLSKWACADCGTEYPAPKRKGCE